MSTVTQLDAAALEAVVARYEIGRPVRHWPAATGVENSNYFVITATPSGEREWVLTILETAPYCGTSLVPLLDACTAAGLPVPRAIRTRDGAALAEIGGKPALLCTRLRGRHLYNPTGHQVQALGRFLARFHRATARLPFGMPAHPRDPAWLRKNVHDCLPWLPYAEQALMQRTLDTITAALARRDVTTLPRGPIHGDLFRDNVLFNEQGLTGVLDFHQAADGYLLYDLTVAVNDWCTDAHGVLDPERTLALLRAYHALRPLTAAELWHFPVFLLYAALSFWVSRHSANLEASRRASPDAGPRVKDPAEFRRILEHHQRHFFYIDPRWLV